MTNPFTPKLEKAKARLAKLERQQDSFNQSATPGTFVTGNSGVSQSRRRKLDRQIDKTVDLAKGINALRAEVKDLELSEQLYSAGKIDADGRMSESRKSEIKQQARARVNETIEPGDWVWAEYQQPVQVIRVNAKSVTIRTPGGRSERQEFRWVKLAQKGKIQVV